MLISRYFLTDVFQFQTQLYHSIPFALFLCHIFPSFLFLSLSFHYSFLLSITLLALQLLVLPHMQYAYNKIKLKLKSFDWWPSSSGKVVISLSHTQHRKQEGAIKWDSTKLLVNNLSMCALSFRLGEMAKWKRAKSTNEIGGLVVTWMKI